MPTMNTVIFPVRETSSATTFYRTLIGADPTMDAPYYVGFHTDGQEIGLDPNGHAQGLDAPVAYWNVDDIESAVAQLSDAGGKVHAPARDVGGGKLVATVADPDGNIVGLIQAG